jgi:ATP-dependent DNA ligase
MTAIGDGAPGWPAGPLFRRNGHDWADRFPAIVDAAHRIKASSFLIDGEVVIARDDGTPRNLG